MKLGDARDAIHDATAIHWRNNAGLDPLKYGTRIDKGAFGSADSMIIDAVEAGRIIGAVESQSEHLRAWLMYAYAAVPDQKYKESLQAILFKMLFASRPKRLRKRFFLVCGAAVDDLKRLYNNGCVFKDAYLANEIGCAESTYSESYKRPLLMVQKELQRFDLEGLGPVISVIDELKRGKR